MRKWIMLSSSVSALAGLVLGALGGMYFGFQAAHRWHGEATMEKRMADVSTARSNWQRALDGDLETIRDTARMHTLVNAQVVAWIYEYLDEPQQQRARRLFGRVLALIEQDGGANEQDAHIVALLEEKLAG